MASIIDDRGYNQGFKPSPTLEIRTKRRSDFILSEMNLNKKNDILEIGCGIGNLSYYIAQNNTNNNVLGTDLCELFINKAKKSYKLSNLEFAILDFNNPLDIANKKFDYIIGNGILHHLYYNLDNTLINLKKLLKKDGKIIFLEPNLLNPYCYLIFNTFKWARNLAKLEPSEKAFTKRFISKKLKNAEFNDIKVQYKDFLLPITPFNLTKPVIFIGDYLEKIPLIKYLTQSIYISARI